MYRGWDTYHRHQIQRRAEKLPSDKQLRYFIDMTTMELNSYNQEKNTSNKTGHVTLNCSEKLFCVA